MRKALFPEVILEWLLRSMHSKRPRGPMQHQNERGSDPPLRDIIFYSYRVAVDEK